MATKTKAVRRTRQPAAIADFRKQRYAIAPLASLKLHPRNPRRGDIDLIESSARENGFYGAIVVQERTNYIIAGNHRFLALQKTGEHEAPVIYVDIDDARALKILLADNATADAATYDNPELAAVLQELVGSAHTDEEINRALAGTAHDAIAFDKLLRELQGGGPAPGHEAPEPEFLIVVDCKNEGTQKTLFERLSSDGYECKLIT